MGISCDVATISSGILVTPWARNWQIRSFWLETVGGLKSVQSSSSEFLRWCESAIELGAGIAAPTDAIKKSKAAWVRSWWSHDGFHNEVTMKCSLSLFLWIPTVSTFGKFCFFFCFFLSRSPVKSSEGSTKIRIAVEGKRRIEKWKEECEGKDERASIISDNGRLERRRRCRECRKFTSLA